MEENTNISFLKRLIFLSAICLLVLITASILDKNLNQLIPAISANYNIKRNEVRVILVWKAHFGLSRTFWESKIKSLTSECREENLRITFDRKELKSAAVVVFPISQIRSKKELPEKAFPNQKFVLMSKESPATDFMKRNGIKAYKDFDDFFDLSITYRNESEVPIPYFKIHLLDDRSGEWSESEYKKKIKGKSKMAAWFVSNYHSVTTKRNNIALTMQKYGVDVDVYGPGHKRCPKNTYERCMAMLENKYKFYLSFENSNCKDYTTEKFFKVLDYKVLPIVLGGGDYKSFVPQSAFIDVASFETVKALAEYLKELDKNNSLYLQHFRWKFNKKVVKSNPTLSMFCALNDYMKTHSMDNHRSKYSNFTKWWYDRQCLTGYQQFNRTFIDLYYEY